MQILNAHNLPDTIIRAIGAPRMPKPNRFSATDIAGPPLARALKDEHYRDLVQEASEMLKMLFGTAWHLLMQNNAGAGVLAELKLEMPWNDIVTISGIIDQYRLLEKKIVDWKTGSVWGFILDGGVKREHTVQLNIYDALLGYHGLPVEKMEVWGLPTDWNAGKALGGNGYPEIPFVVKDIPFISIAPVIDTWIQRYRDKDPCTLPKDGRGIPPLPS